MAAQSRKNEAWPEPTPNERDNAQTQKDRLIEAFMMEFSIRAQPQQRTPGAWHPGVDNSQRSRCEGARVQTLFFNFAATISAAPSYSCRGRCRTMNTKA